MNLLVFEYSTCVDSFNLQIEGYHMLKALLSDLNSISEHNVDFLVNSHFKDIFFDNCNRIVLNCNLYSWLEDYVQDYDSVFFIAPEDDYIQYRLTKYFEDKNMEIIGSNSYASCICSSKNKTYERTDESILKIPSRLIDINSIDYNIIKSYLNHQKIIVKPDNKTSSDLIYCVENVEELKKILDIYKKNNLDKCLLQKYIEGKPLSVSIICNDEYVELISINTQEMKEKDNKIMYNGCRTNITHPLEDKIKKISKTIIKSINGLKGYVGIDYIIDDERIYFVEINSRITTPFISLQKTANKNLTKHIIDISKKKSDNIDIIREGLFLKEV